MNTEQEFDALGNPFRVGDLVEMTRQHIRERLDGPERRDSAVVLKLCGRRHILVHRHGAADPEFFHVSIWEPADKTALKIALAKTYETLL